MKDETMLEKLTEELSTSNVNIKSLIDVTKDQISTHEKINTENVTAFKNDRDNIMVGVDKIASFVMSNNEVVKANNEAITTAFAGFLQEVVGIKDGLNDVTKSLREVSEQIIEHRVQTGEWRAQANKDNKVYMDMFKDIEHKLEDVGKDVNSLRTDVEVLKSKQEGNKELNGIKIDNVRDRGETIYTTEHNIKTRNISTTGVIVAVVIGLLGVAAGFLVAK